MIPMQRLQEAGPRLPSKFVPDCRKGWGDFCLPAFYICRLGARAHQRPCPALCLILIPGQIGIKLIPVPWAEHSLKAGPVSRVSLCSQHRAFHSVCCENGVTICFHSSHPWPSAVDTSVCYIELLLLSQQPLTFLLVSSVS